MTSNGRYYLIIAGALSSVIALLHLLIMVIGESAYRYFPGLGDEFADMLKAGSIIPTVIVIIITGIFFVFSLYAFSGGKIIPSLPLQRLGLVSIGIIYLLRGLMNLPYYAYIIFSGVKIEKYNSMIYDSISFGIAMFFLIGTKLEWNKLKTGGM